MDRENNDIGGGNSAEMALGRQMTVEFYDCDSHFLADAAAMKTLFIHAAEAAGAHVVDAVFHSFQPQGVSGVVVISESHFAVHAWPEHDYAAVDLFTCGEHIDFDRAIAELATGMSCGQWIISSFINRGILGANGVERFVPVLESRDSRAFQLSWRSRFDKSNARAISAAFDIYNCSGIDPEEPGESLENFARSLMTELELESSGDWSFSSENDRCCDFEQPISGGRLFGFYYPEPQVVYVDLFLNRFFDPRHAAEFAMSALGGGYYRLQPHVRQ
jgi:S-adenosylmethionine decarboxylase